MNRIRFSVCLASLFSLFSSITFPVIAQEAEASLEEVVVTAQRREQGLHDVPIAITALGGAFLAEKQVFDTESLSLYTPSLHIFAEQTGSEFYTIRGIGRANEDLASDSGVAVFIDDVYVPRQGAANLALFDVERVEILRGPQGTLWGKNAVGGAINIITRKPGDEMSGYVSADLAEHSTVNVRGGVSAPLVEDTLYGRLAFSTRNRDGLYRNLNTDEEANDTDVQAFRGSLRFTPGERTTIDFSADWEKVEQDGVLKSIIVDVPGTPYILKDFFKATFPTQEDNVRTSRAGTHGEQGVEQYGFNLTARHSFDNADLTLVSGLRFEDSYNLEDNDRAPEKSAQVFSEQESWHFSQEIRLSSSNDSNMSWTAGLYYFHDNGDRDQMRFSDFFGPGGLVGPGSPEIQNSTTTFKQHLITDAYAAFGELTYRFAERLSITLGGRYSYEKKDYDINAFAVANPGSTTSYSLFQPGGNYTAADAKSWEDFSPKAVLSYELVDNVNTYFSFTKGFKSGGYNGSPDTAADVIPFRPEEATQYEIGLKGRLMDGRLSANLAGFFIDFEDLQLQGFDPETGSPITNNAAQAEILGAEIEFDLLVNNLLLNFGASYLDHEFKEFAIEVFDPTIEGGPPFRLVNKAGDRLGAIPKYNIHAGATYTWPLSSGASFSISGDLVAVDETITIFDTLWSDSYEVFNVRATWRSASGNWDVSLWAKNVTDNDYYRGGGPVPDIDDKISRLGLFADPRIVGGTITWRFNE